MSILSRAEPADFADVRATNLAVVLQYVREHAPCSRADIAAATRLNKATVSSLVADLLERRLVREIGLSAHRIGRPPTMIELDGDPYAVMGVQVNADGLTIVALDLAGTELLSWRRSFDTADLFRGTSFAAPAAAVKRAVQKLSKDGHRILGITVGVPGLVSESGVAHLATAADHPGIDVAASLGQALGKPDVPVTVENDAALAVAAEFHSGSHAGSRDLVYLTGGISTGAGVISDGTLLRGAHRFAGAIGHLRLDPAGPPCTCGQRGCLEALAGISAILRRSSPEVFTGDVQADWQPEIDEVVRRAAAGDDAVLDVLADAGTWLGHGAAALACMVDPEAIILGGYYGPLARWLLPAAESVLADRSGLPKPPPAIVASALDHRAVAIGGATRLLEAIDPSQLHPRSD